MARISKAAARKAGLTVPRRHKYNARRTTVGDVTFASKKEAKRYGELLALERAGEIKNLLLQTTFVLTVNDVDVGKYLSDFSYYDERLKERIYEDVKGFKTPVYRLKKKLVLAIYGITIREV